MFSFSYTIEDCSAGLERVVVREKFYSRMKKEKKRETKKKQKRKERGKDTINFYQRNVYKKTRNFSSVLSQ